MSIPTKLDHCVIHVTNWERSNDFYTRVMGAELVARPVGYAYRFGDRGAGIDKREIDEAKHSHGGSANDVHLLAPDPVGEVPAERNGYCRQANRRRLSLNWEAGMDRCSANGTDPSATRLGDHLTNSRCRSSAMITSATMRLPSMPKWPSQSAGAV
jgi:catechol 2,3-dioxygenase-like lactoylglutathione lyase family enzyme